MVVISHTTEPTRTKDARARIPEADGVGQRLIAKKYQKKTATIAKPVGTALDYFLTRTNKIAIYMAVKPVTMKK